MIAFLAGTLVGTISGFMVAALCHMAKERDQR